MKIYMLLVLIITLVAGCIFEPVITPVPSPAVPEVLQNLPRTAWAETWKTIWEKPGLAPLDPNSDTSGDRGDYLGVIEGDGFKYELSPVEAVRYTWSGYDEEFYVYIKYEDIKGWIPLEALTFDPPE